MLEYISHGYLLNYLVELQKVLSAQSMALKTMFLPPLSLDERFKLDPFSIHYNIIRQTLEGTLETPGIHPRRHL